MNAFIISVILFVVIFLAGGIFFVMKMKENDEFKLKINIIYLIITALLLSGLSLLSFLNLNAATVYMIFHGGSILLGLFHSLILYKILLWTEKDSFLPETLFTLLATLLGIIVFMLISHLVVKNNLTLLYTTGLTSFLLPILIHKAYQFDLLVPVKEYKKWHFPEEVKVMETDIHEHLLISLLIGKRFNSDEYSEFTIRAPLYQNLGDVFCYFINGYNQQQINNEIEDLDKDVNGQALDWLFYTKSPLFGKKNYVNPERTIKENGLKEKQIVYTQRVY